VRLIRKWLNAGVMEEGRRTQSDVGTVQGGSISPVRVASSEIFMRQP